MTQPFCNECLDIVSNDTCIYCGLTSQNGSFLVATDSYVTNQNIIKKYPGNSKLSRMIQVQQWKDTYSKKEKGQHQLLECVKSYCLGRDLDIDTIEQIYQIVQMIFDALDTSKEGLKRGKVKTGIIATCMRYILFTRGIVLEPIRDPYITKANNMIIGLVHSKHVLLDNFNDYIRST